MIKRIAITPGEPAGVGPDIVIDMSRHAWKHELVVCCDPNLLEERAKLLGVKLKLIPYNNKLLPKAQEQGTLTVAPIFLKNKVNCGELNVENADYVIETLTYAGSKNLDKEFAAIVTGPVNKGIINQAGIEFSGHTEFFANQANCEVVMMLAAPTLNVALVTTHVPLMKVPNLITKQRLERIINVLNSELKQKYNIEKPKIYVCGLNPHAGEDGHLGHEEIDVIIPTLNEMRKQGINLIGPLAADTIFQDKYILDADVVLAMYHDQGLPVLKTLGFGKSINITLGLPYVRVSVDHGTALELAGRGFANSDSMLHALNKAIELIS